MNKGWQTKSLGDVLVKTETNDPTRLPDAEFDYIDVSSISNETLTIQETQRLKGKDAPSRARRHVRTNDVLLATVRPTLRRIAIVPEELDEQICSTGYFVLRAKPEVDFRFIFYFLQTEVFMAAMERLQKGASYPAVTDGDVRSQPIPVPSLSEQQRIVGLLDEAFASLATAQAHAAQNLQNARDLFESHLNAIFTQRGKGWVEKTLGDICDFVGGSQPPKAVFSKTKTPNSIRLIQIRDYKSDNHVVYIPKAQARRFCTVDDIMIGRYGPPIFQILRGLEGAYNVALMKAVPDEAQVNRDFLFYFLKHPAILEYVIYHSERAAGQIGVTKETLAPYPIAMPSLDKQVTVAANINALAAETQRLTRIYEQKLAALAELKKSLLHQAFSGEL
jgi:type I restriction enzyme S subunit